MVDDSDSGQASLSAFQAGTTTESVTRTVVFPLETSQTKNEAVRTAVEEYQAALSYMGDMMPSIPEYGWNPQDTTLYRMVQRKFPERTVSATTLQSAQEKVASSFRSWKSNGKSGDRPRFGEGSWFGLKGNSITVKENDRGYGIKASFIPYNPVWFHANTSEFHDEYLQRVVDGDASSGSAEMHLSDDGGLHCHLTVTDTVEVYEPGDVSTFVGVDLGESTIFAAVVVHQGDVEAVEMESGREYRHHRERLKQKKAELQREGHLRSVRGKKVRVNYDRYTDHVTNVVSRQIVDLASEHAPCTIRLEDLTDYRQSAKDPIHDWPFADIQVKICYKATAAGIPVEFVDSRNTSITCRKCGQADPANRNGAEFHCRRCQYQVHADVNAAANIAQDTRGEF